MNIPFFGIDRLYKQHSKRLLNTIEKVYSHGSVLMGPEVEEFERNVAQMCNRKYGIAVGSCTDALYFALLSAGITEGDEVLITSFSFIASMTPIIRIRAIPVFVDIEPDYFMMDISDLEHKITKKTKAIVAVHLFGQMLPFDEIKLLAKENNLILIEDAAQSLGSFCDNKPAGGLGLCSCISFDPTKIIGAFGNGGILLTDDKKMFESVIKIRYHGKNISTGEFEILGYNSRLSSSQAAILNVQFDWLDGWIKRRREIAKLYERLLNNCDAITLPKIRHENDHIYHKYVLLSDNRNELKAFMAKKVSRQ